MQKVNSAISVSFGLIDEPLSAAVASVGTASANVSESPAPASVSVGTGESEAPLRASDGKEASVGAAMG